MSKRNESVGVLTPKTFRHDLSHSHTTTLDWFRLQPVCCVEMVENDKFTVNLSALVEAAPLATKVYGSAYLDFHAFFVPSRILWSDWNNYRYGNNRSNSNNFVIPHLDMKNLRTWCGLAKIEPKNGEWEYSVASPGMMEKRRVFGSLGYPVSAILNYVGDGSIPVDTSYQDMLISAMQVRAYQRIWWDWYRDSVNLEESAKSVYIYNSGGKVNSQELVQLFTPRYRCWRKDYITTLLTNPQLGAEPAQVNYPSEDATGNSISVTALRGAVAMQRFLEKLNVTGTRPIERIQALFGGAPSPVRLDMSELIGSHRHRVTISGLTNTGSSNALGQQASEGYGANAFGIDYENTSFGVQTGRSYGESQSKNFAYSATEDGYFIVIASLMPDFVNPTATNRQFFRGLSTPDASREDFYTHEFDGLSYQECLLNEVAMPEYTRHTQGLWGAEYDPYRVAGYQPKYEDYRYLQDRLSGDFNEHETSTALRNMVFVRNFQDGSPSGYFPQGLALTTPTDIDRVNFDNHFQVTNADYDHFVLNLFFNIDAVRPISKVELPTELSDMANSLQTDVANGGIRL